MKICGVPTRGVCGASAKNYGISSNYVFFYIVNDSTCIKPQKNGSCSIIIHIDDLKEIYTNGDFMFFLFSFLVF